MLYEAQVHIAMWARASLFRRFTHTNACKVRENIENSPQNIRGWIHG